MGEGMQELLTFQEAMEYLRVSRPTLYRFLKAGKIVGHKVGSTWRFYPSELQQVVHAQDVKQHDSG